MLQKSKEGVYDDWMNATGYNLFISSIKHMLTKYDQMVYQHIAKDLHAPVFLQTSSATFFEDCLAALEVISLRIKNVKQFSRLKESPPELTIHLNVIYSRLNTYLSNGVNTYSGATLNLVDVSLTMVDYLCSLFKKVFATNPLEACKEVLDNKRNALLGGNLLENFTIEVFEELDSKNKITATLFENSLRNVFAKAPNRLKEIVLAFTSTARVTQVQSCIDIFMSMNVIMDFALFLSSLDTIVKYYSRSTTDEILEVIAGFICKFFLNNSHTAKFLVAMNFWFSLNWHNIYASSKEIQFLYYQVYNKYVVQNIPGMTELYNSDELNKCTNNLNTLLARLKFHFNKLVEIANPKHRFTSKCWSHYLGKLLKTPFELLFRL